MQGRLRDTFIHNWDLRLGASTRANSYKLFLHFNFQQYLNLVNTEKYKYTLSRLRMSSHRLEIEASRWYRPKEIELNQRKCKHCDTLQDEFHFLFECQII